MPLDPLLRLALALESNPGVYAVLLGSGVSRAAGIPTGWEVVLDLIGRLAAADGADPGPDPASWYRTRFSEDPQYTFLLDRLAATAAERAAILRAYFEPTDEDREAGRKLPTPAHRAVARLAALGVIRVIVTTNFDRLTEQALEQEGIVPDVIASKDAFLGAVPLVHARVVVLKLHGDYRDTRIRNTAQELAAYPAVVAGAVDRVLSEFGLIICGWSGAWDAALRAALLRDPVRRYTTYWALRSAPSEEAKELIAHRQAVVVETESADRFFGDLVEKVEAIRELENANPLSVAVAVASVKRHLADRTQRIRLHDLFVQELERTSSELASDRFTANPTAFGAPQFRERLSAYEGVTARLRAMASALAYHGGSNASPILELVLNGLLEPPRHEGNTIALALQDYPALLVGYSAGVAAIASNRLSSAGRLIAMEGPRDFFGRGRRPLIEVLRVWPVFEGSSNALQPPGGPREFTPAHNHLHDVLRRDLLSLIPSETAFDDAYDGFEYLINLVWMDRDDAEGLLPGRLVWKYGRRAGRAADTAFDRLERRVLERGDSSPLLRSGVFRGSVERFRAVASRFRDDLEQATARYGYFG
jgi:hypothetical protein